MNTENNKNKNKGPESPNPNIKNSILLALVLIMMVSLYFVVRQNSSTDSKEGTYTALVNEIKEKNVKEIKYDMKDQSAIYSLKNGTMYKAQIIKEVSEKLFNDAIESGAKVSVVEVNNTLDTIFNILPTLLSLAFMIFLIRMLYRSMNSKGGGIMGLGKNTAKLYDQNTGVTFLDVAGQEEAKESLTEIVDFLHNPQKYAQIGAKLPKGALLVGPPGTGKTLLAKAVAGEAKVPFFSQSGSAFVEMFVGMGAARVRDIFKEAETKAPCIIFIDEIDAIGKSRENAGMPGGNDEREQTLNQLLAEMDGFDSNKGIVILAATNRPEVLDKALLRPGRFDRRVIVDAPDLKGREAILKVHSKDVKMSDDVDLLALAKATPGAVGADLANIINEGALRAVKNGRQFVSQDDLMEAIEVVIAGQQKKDRIMSEKEKRVVAFHEIGHALVAALQKNTDPVVKITIIPRTMGSLGYTLQVPNEDKYLMSKDEMLQEISILLGGRSAEEVEFGSITTGASNDIQRATSMARKMVSMYGMSDEFDMMALESNSNVYLDGRAVSIVSNETQTKLDMETKRIIKECHDRAVSLLKENKDLLTAAAERLLEKETMAGSELVEIIRQFKGRDFIKDEEEIEEEAKKASNNEVDNESLPIIEEEKNDINPSDLNEGESSLKVEGEEVEAEESKLEDAENSYKIIDESPKDN